MMTRKDYVATAEILSMFKDSIDELTFHDLVDEFCGMFEADNTRFNSEKFFESCNKDNY